DDGYSKLGAGAREPTFELRDAAEQPQRDRVDLDPLAAGDPRMPELVKKDRRQEQQGGDDPHRDVGAVGEPRVLRREDAFRQRPRDQREDGDQAPVEPTLDAAEAADRDVAIHRPLPAFRSASAGTRAADLFAGHRGLLSYSFAL